MLESVHSYAFFCVYLNMHAAIPVYIARYQYIYIYIYAYVYVFI